jgi:hypothetical protein
MSGIAVAVERAQADDQRKERDFSDRKKPRVVMKEYDSPPKGALTWESHAAGKTLRHWRRACFWRWRRSLLVRSLTVLLPDYAAGQGYAWVGNAALARECWAAKPKIDAALTEMINGDALIRIYALDGDKLLRRLYLAKAIVDEFDESSSKTDDAIIENR